MHENYNRTDFDKKTWIFVGDPNNPPAGSVSFHQDEFNRHEEAIDSNRRSLHAAIHLLPDDHLGEFDAFDLYPYSAFTTFNVTSWNGLSGIVDTRRGNVNVQYLMTASGDFRRTSLSVDVPVWQASTSYLLGDLVKPTTSSNIYYEAVQAGTSDITEPLWPGDTVTQVTDNTVIWQGSGNFWGAWVAV